MRIDDCTSAWSITDLKPTAWNEPRAQMQLQSSAHRSLYGGLTVRMTVLNLPRATPNGHLETTQRSDEGKAPDAMRIRTDTGR